MPLVVSILVVVIVAAIVSAIWHRARHPNSTEPPPWLAWLPLFPFVVLAAIGFILSLIVHVLSVFGVQPPGGDIVFILHLGIFVIWIPAVLLNQRPGAQKLKKELPLWMKYGLGIAGVYAILNFGYFMVVAPKRGSAEAHQHPAPAKVVRGFSGHWMLFYGGGFCFLWCDWKERKRIAATNTCEPG